jgi:hypothetical protein
MTMRLIDADALKEEIEFHPTSVSVCMTVAEAKGQTYFKNRCLEDIDNALTIDAIPVEWLRNLCAIAKMETDDEMFIDWLIQTWQKEQEAQK